MIRKLLLLVIAGCATPAPPVTHVSPPPAAPPPLPPPPSVIGEAVTLPPEPPPPVMHTSCIAATTGAQGSAKKKIYDFNPIPLEPVTYGPRIAQRPAAGWTRTARTIRAAVALQHDRLADCFRGAKGVRISRATHGRPYVSRDVAMTIDPQGFPRDVTVAGTDALSKCMRESFAAIRVNLRVPRETRVTGVFNFAHPLEAKPLAKLPPPPPAIATAASCMSTLEPVPADALPIDALGEVDFRVDPDSAYPSYAMPRPCSGYTTDKLHIRATIDSNLGTLRACHAAARQRDPKLAGVVNVGFVIETTGEPAQVVVTGAGDDELHRCLEYGLAATTLGSSPETVEVHIPFDLDAPAPKAAADPLAAIAARDVDAAAAMYAEQARTATSIDAGCRARMGIVTAYASVPWTVDERVIAAVGELARFTVRHARKEQRACLADALPRLVQIAEWPRITARPFSWKAGGLAEAVARSSDLVAKFPELEGEVLPFIGESLLLLERDKEAKAIYLRMLERGGSHEEVERAAEGYHTAAVRERAPPTIDACEEVSY